MSARAGSICMRPAETVYLTLPVEVVDLLQEKYLIDLVKKRKAYNIWVNLVEERPHINEQVNNQSFQLRIIYELEAKQQAVRLKA